MRSFTVTLLLGAAALSALSFSPVVAAPPAPSPSASPSASAAGASPGARFAEASRLLRAGRHAAAYGRFVTLANEGDREAAAIALVMHRHGPILFGSVWDATTEELEYWSELARSADRAEIEARLRLGPRPIGVGTGQGVAEYLAPETFRGDRRRKR